MADYAHGTLNPKAFKGSQNVSQQQPLASRPSRFYVHDTQGHTLGQGFSAAGGMASPWETFHVVWSAGCRTWVLLLVKSRVTSRGRVPGPVEEE